MPSAWVFSPGRLRFGFDGTVRWLDDGGVAPQLVPGEVLAIDGAAQGFDEHEGEELAVGEALQPDVSEEPPVAAVASVAALQGEGDDGGDEVDEQEHEEEQQQLIEAGGVGRLGVEVFVPDEVLERTDDEHDVDEGRDQGQQDLEDEDVGQGDESERAFAGKGRAVLPDGLEDSEGPAEALAHEAVGGGGRLGKGQGAVLVLDLVAVLQQ